MIAYKVLAQCEPRRVGRSQLRTIESHDALDDRIMAGRPFADRMRYAAFLQVPYQFHRDIDPLYESNGLAGALPDMQRRRRRGLILQDLADLESACPTEYDVPAFKADPDIPAALGWLHSAEGSNVGAAFLLKDAAKCGLSARLGARDFAAAPKGRGKYWKTFTATLDGVGLDLDEEQSVIAGGCAAFARVRDLVNALLPRVNGLAPVRLA